MLSRDDNELLTRTGRGTPMGELLRQYWQPILVDWEVEADGAPVRVRALGEDLLAFRDTAGKVGLVAENCPHRGASLFFGRNEEAGLRCVYHGWKFDTSGACVDMPNEPPESNFKHKVHVTAYPCEEAGGFIWAYMGPLNPPPPLPELEWMALPATHRRVAKRLQYCNWVQAMEGDIDQSHVSFLHSLINPDQDTTSRRNIARIRSDDKHPRFEVLSTDYGVLIASGRDVPPDQKYWRVTQWAFPFLTMTGPYGENPSRDNRMWVPMDDEKVMVFGVKFNPGRPLDEDELEQIRKGGGGTFIAPENFLPPSSVPGGRWRPRAGLENDFFIDRQAQKTTSYSGIPEFWAQDAGMQLTMGRIYDRSKERLGSSDTAIIQVRRRLIEAARDLRDRGVTPPGVQNPSLYRIRGAAVLVPKEESWVQATAEHRIADPATNPAGV